METGKVSSSNDVNNSTTIQTWKHLVEITSQPDGTEKCREAAKACSISYEQIANDLCNSAPADFDKQIHLLPRRYIYPLWENLFLKVDTYKDFTEGMSKQALVALQKIQANQKKCLTVLTTYVMDVYRTKLIINEDFVNKLFRHKLEKLIYMLLDNRRFYKITLKEGTLEDLCLALSCEYADVKTFNKLVSFVNINHMAYALQFASYEFLMYMWKVRGYIPDFKKNIDTLKKSMIKQDWKQIKFFSWCDEYT